VTNNWPDETAPCQSVARPSSARGVSSEPRGATQICSAQTSTCAGLAGQQRLKNHILAELPEAESTRILQQMKTVALPPKRVLYQVAERIRYVYFPIDAVISLVSVMEDGASVEVGAVGHEGMLGVPLLLGNDTADTQARTQIAGAALRMRAEMFRAEVHQSEKFKALLLRYAHGLMTQVAQTAACNRLHSVGGRLARWLLIAADRTGRNDLPFTHEFIAQMLGVRRAGVTVAAGMLSDAGMIGYTRGHIHILDRRGLEASACECYEVVKNEFDLLPKPAA